MEEEHRIRKGSKREERSGKGRKGEGTGGKGKEGEVRGQKESKGKARGGEGRKGEERGGKGAWPNLRAAHCPGSASNQTYVPRQTGRMGGLPWPALHRIEEGATSTHASQRLEW